MKTVDVHDAKTGLSGLLAEVEKSGKRIVICRNGKPAYASTLLHPYANLFASRGTFCRAVGP